MANVVSNVMDKLYSNPTLGKKMAGNHSLVMGEIIAFAVALLVYKFGGKIPVVGKWHKYICFAIILVAFLIW